MTPCGQIGLLVPAMHYISTRSAAPPVDFETVLLSGMAPDGGLYVPQQWPQFSKDEFQSWRGLPYAALAFKIIQPFVGGAIGDADLQRMIDEAYGTFHHADVTPLHWLDDRFYILELFHGPTLAFKDVALQLLGRLFDHVLEKRNQNCVIVGATSGDTGSAAIEALRHSRRCQLFMLHPDGRVSDIQRRQMTSVVSDTIFNIAVKGSFDDCQALVKKLFADQDFHAALTQKNLTLSAVNSINWARIMAQIVYYIYAALQLGAHDENISHQLRFVVPTGNFGNVYAAYAARQMGLPIGELVIATNANDIVTQFFHNGVMQKREVQLTLSNAMDIQISSNFERYLFDLLGRDPALTQNAMQEFATNGMFDAAHLLDKAQSQFTAFAADDITTIDIMQRIHRNYNYIADPHTAVGINAACQIAQNDQDKTITTICLACAAPAKFPEAVKSAIDFAPPLPPHLADLVQRPEHFARLDNDEVPLKEFVLSNA